MYFQPYKHSLNLIDLIIFLGLYSLAIVLEDSIIGILHQEPRTQNTVTRTPDKIFLPNFPTRGEEWQNLFRPAKTFYSSDRGELEILRPGIK